MPDHLPYTIHVGDCLHELQTLPDESVHCCITSPPYFGLSDSDWRERIGNAVPPAAAEAIAGVMGTTLLLAEAGETFMLSNTPIWVRPVAVALSVAQQEVQP